MMFMPQPQGQLPPNLIGDNNYGIGQNRLLDATLQRMNETIEQVQQDALNNSRRQDEINDLRHDRQQQEHYTRDNYISPSQRGAGAGFAYERSRTQ
jgi:hypothetical protein